MRTWAAILLCGSVMTAAASGAINTVQGGKSATATQEEKNVLATLEALSQANRKQDRSALTALVHESVSYGHSNGLVQNKTVAIDYMLGRKTNVLRWEKPVVTVIDNLAMVRAIQVVQLADAKTGTLTDSSSNVLWVLAKGPGPHGWQIAARQNFRPEAEQKWIEERNKKQK